MGLNNTLAAAHTALAQLMLQELQWMMLRD
jgi:hypothetical protein